MTRPAILERLRGVQRAGNGWLAFCPGHADQHKRSLSISVGNDGRTLLNCHAHGCPPERIAGAVEMTLADLAPPRVGADNGHRPPRREVATYGYCAERGEPLFEVVRLEPKDFRCRRPDGRGGWTWNLDGVRVVPYRLHELAGARRVYVTEGERDCDTLVDAHGLTATTNHGGAGKWREAHTQVLVAAAVRELVVLRDNDVPGAAHQEAVARACAVAGLRVKCLELPGLPPLREKHGEDVTDWLAAGHTRDELEALAEDAPLFVANLSAMNGPTMTEPLAKASPTVKAASAGAPEPELHREGLDLALVWSNGIRLGLASIRDGRDGVRGELTVTHSTRRLSWGSLSLSSTQAREALRKKLDNAAPGLPWGEYLEEACYRLTQAAREGEPIITLTGKPTSPTRELLPRLFYQGQPTLIYADGDTGKSLLALTFAMAVHSGAALPFGLEPAHPAPSGYLDWEGDSDTHDERLALLAAGAGIDPPAIFYKRMSRPLVDEAGALAAEFARRRIGFVVIDSKMFALASVEGAFHEPVTAFYNALRLFAPAATLVLNHITNDAAKSGSPARPFGGAFAFNGPRLVWEAKRDHSVTDATAIVFTCRKANNLARKPEPFGLRFVPGSGCISVRPFDLSEAAPETVAGASLTQRVTLALTPGALTIAELAEHLNISEDTAGRIVRRLREKGRVVQVGETRPYRWGLAVSP